MKILIALLMTTLAISVNAQQSTSTAAANVHVVDSVFTIEGLERERQVRIYLPPDYETTNDRYPVLYMHDGQNLFDDTTSFVGEWGVDEILNELYTEKRMRFIVVGIDNGQANRIHELTAWDHPKYGKAEGKPYMDFIVHTVKPYIDQTYRTINNPQNTAIIGSSLGGLISHYAIFEYPQVFGKAGILSPSYWWGEGPFIQVESGELWGGARLYLLMGGKEGPQMVDSFQRMLRLLDEKGYSRQLKSKLVPEGEHNEQFWRREFKEVVLWLFGGPL
ncbi:MULTISPECIES: alpha/beta hydrolase-fold protein [Roseivirga]|uniref:alpha/beta hydrolase n=1 Tax=Roseivirga TaxID=290180 RepID=UPI00257B2F61|nr:MULTISPECIES: alpha/beta hydrolase-fold protein [Roseivirga]